MPKLRTLRAVDGDYAQSGPNSTTLRQVINKPAEAVFAALCDGPAWKEWLGIDVEWTSPQPFGIGTTRTVRVAGQQIDETFLVWESPLRMGFRFDRATLPVAAFAEDYTLVRLDEARCELRWSYAYEWGGPLPSVFGRIFGFGFKQQSVRALKKLAAMMEATDRFDG